MPVYFSFFPSPNLLWTLRCSSSSGLITWLFDIWSSTIHMKENVHKQHCSFPWKCCLNEVKKPNHTSTQFVLHSPITFMVHFPSNVERPDYPLHVRLLHTLIIYTNWKNKLVTKIQHEIFLFLTKKNPINDNLLSLQPLSKITGGWEWMKSQNECTSNLSWWLVSTLFSTQSFVWIHL